MRSPPRSIATETFLLLIAGPSRAQVTQRVSTAPDASPSNGESGLSEAAAISGDGRWVALGSVASNLVSGDTNGFLDVFALNATETGIVVIPPRRALS